METSWGVGCVEKAEGFMNKHIMFIIIVLAIGFVLELVCMAAGCYIAREVRGYKRV